MAWAVYGLIRFLHGGEVVGSLRESLGPHIDRFVHLERSEIDLGALVQEQGREFLAEAARVYSRHVADEFAAEKRLFENVALQLDAREDLWPSDGQQAVFIKQRVHFHSESRAIRRAVASP